MFNRVSQALTHILFPYSRHIWQTKWSEADRRTNTYEVSPGGMGGGPAGPGGPGGRGGGRGRRARSLNRAVHYEGRHQQPPMGNGYDDEGRGRPPESEFVTSASLSPHVCCQQFCLVSCTRTARTCKTVWCLLACETRISKRGGRRNGTNVQSL